MRDVVTLLDAAHAAVSADPENETLRLRFFERLADGELVLLLDRDPVGDSVEPKVFDLEDGPVILVFDREDLPYLNAIEKFNCFYCSYGNGVAAYTREVAARTEQYWCPIKHARRIKAAHDRYPLFFDHGDAEAFRQGLNRLRRQYDDTDKAGRR